MPTEQESRWKIIRNMQDDCLIALENGDPLPTAALQALPPWRAVMLARIAVALGGVPALEHGTLAQLETEAKAVMRNAELLGEQQQLGNWWDL
jgi:hypothetical protein